MTTMANAKASLEFVDRLSKFLEKLKNFKPELKSLRVNYLDRTAEMKLLLNIPQGIRRVLNEIEIPAYPGYVIHEVFDGCTLNRIDLRWKQKGQNWVADPSQVSSSDKYFVIMKGSISQEALDQLVKLYCPQDPKRTPELDLYWIDSAIKDMAILEKIYDELNIDKVATCVIVGLERQFSSSLPHEVTEYFKARAEADMYLASKDRQMGFKSFYKLRLAQRRAGKVSPTDIYDLSSKVLNPDVFMYFISVDEPFTINSLVPLEGKSLYPEKIAVGVQTDLNYRTPVAQGDLTFKKLEFATRVEEEVSNIPGLPKSLIRKKKA